MNFNKTDLTRGCNPLLVTDMNKNSLNSTCYSSNYTYHFEFHILTSIVKMLNSTKIN